MTLFDVSHIRYVINIRNLLFALLILVTFELVTFNPTKCATMGSLFGLCAIKRLHRSGDVKTGWIWSGLRPKSKPPLCPLIPPTIVGKVPVTTAVYSWEALEDKFHTLKMGGRYYPANCTARHRVAIVLPFRDREMHLKVFLNNLHPFLQNQQLDYGIFIVDLMPEVTFNRAMLLNIGFLEALKLYNYQCFIFHDVDLIPEMGHNMYSCPENPRHMSVAIDTMHYRLPYNNIFGGVVAMTREQFEQVNGFSNKYFGWGGEDDDMYNRIRLNNMSITRYPGDVARYKMLSHKRENGNPDRFHLLRGSQKRWQKDGINTAKYRRVKLELRRLYTYLLVDIDEVDIMSDGQYNRSHQQQHQNQLQQQYQEQQIDQKQIEQQQLEIARQQKAALQQEHQKQLGQQKPREQRKKQNKSKIQPLKHEMRQTQQQHQENQQYLQKQNKQYQNAQQIQPDNQQHYQQHNQPIQSQQKQQKQQIEQESHIQQQQKQQGQLNPQQQKQQGQLNPQQQKQQGQLNPQQQKQQGQLNPQQQKQQGQHNPQLQQKKQVQRIQPQVQRQQNQQVQPRIQPRQEQVKQQKQQPAKVRSSGGVVKLPNLLGNPVQHGKILRINK